MKNRTKKIFAVLVALAQLLTILALGVFAEDAEETPYLKACNIYRVEPAQMVIDGEVSDTEPWSRIDAIQMYTLKGVLVDKAVAKALWAKDEQGTYVYMLLSFVDSDGEQSGQSAGCTWNDGDAFQLAIDETGTASGAVNGWNASATVYRTGTKSAVERAQLKEQNIVYTTKRVGTTVTIEAVFTLNNSAIAENALIGINAFGQLRTDKAGSPTQFSFNAKNVNTSAETFVKGTLSKTWAKDTVPGQSIVPETAEVVVMNVAGAATHIGEPYQLRFGATVGRFDEVKDSVKSVGMIIVKTELLTDAVVSAGITKEALTAAGIAFEDIACEVGAEFAATVNAEALDTNYSAIGYAVKTDDSVVYASYSATDNVRSVKTVAEKAYADRTSMSKNDYTFKQSAKHGVPDFETRSYSPYANTQLDVLKVMAGIS